MNTSELQRLKMAWLAAKEAGDATVQVQILRDHPDEQDALIDFIAAYHAMGGGEAIDENTPLLTSTQQALQTALNRVFEGPTQSQLAFATLSELRQGQHLKKADVARGLRLSLDVWNKFENGAIELASLSKRQVERLAHFFHVSIDQFGTLLNGSQPVTTLNYRQTSEAAKKQQGPQKQTFKDAIARSTMSAQDKAFWLEPESL
jgi:transcriptional regulator with XRE-family HTH domain